MERRKLGTTDIEVSKICLGTMNWGQQNTEGDAHEQLDYAVSHGVNFIDTAEVYPVPPEPALQGRTETYLGTWLKKRGKRDDLIIATKVASRKQKGSFLTRTVSGLTRANIRAAIEGSLLRLQTDYVDLYQTHSPDRPANHWGVRGITEASQDDGAALEETLSALGELVKEGKVRFIGVSNETPWGIMKHLELAQKLNLLRIVSIQNQYSLLNRIFELGLSEITFREQVGLLAYSPLSGGVLSGKYLDGVTPPGARFTIFERNRRYNAPEVQGAVSAYVRLAEKYALDPAQMALAFVNDRPFVTANIIGCTSVEQLKADIASADLKLSEEIMTDIAEIYKRIPDPHA